MKKEEINSWLVSIYLCESVVCSIISCFIKINNISGFLMLGLIFVDILYNKKVFLNRMRTAIVIFGILEFLLLLSGYINGTKNIILYALYFTVFGFAAMILSLNDIRCEYVIRYIGIIYILYYVCYFLFIRKKFLNSGMAYFGQSMAISYAASVSVYIFWAIIIYKKEIKIRKYDRMTVFVNFTIAIYIMMLDCQSRGPLVAVILGAILFLLSKLKFSNKIIFIVVGLVLFAAVMTNFVTIIFFVSHILNALDIHINAIDKVIFLYNSGIGIDNGRNVYFKLALDSILNSPVFGNGVGYFETLTNGEYVHNIFLELFVNFGVGALFFIWFIFYKPFIYIFASKEGEKTVFILLIFCMGEMILNFSSSYWLTPAFWYMFFLFLQNENRIIKKVSN